MVHFRAGPVDPVKSDVDLLIVGMPELSRVTQANASPCALDAALAGTLSHLRAGRLFDGRFGETMILSSPPPPVRCRSLLIVGMGDIDLINPDRLGVLSTVAMRTALQLDSCTIACLLNLLDPTTSDSLLRSAARSMMAGTLTALDAHPTPSRFTGMTWTFDQPAVTVDPLRQIIAQWPAAPR